MRGSLPEAALLEIECLARRVRGSRRQLFADMSAQVLRRARELVVDAFRGLDRESMVAPPP